MRTYGQNYFDTMAMPMRAFWFISGCVERLNAESQKQHLEITTAAQSSKGAGAMFEVLNAQSPPPVVMSVRSRIEVSAVRDEVGFAELRGLAG